MPDEKQGRLSTSSYLTGRTRYRIGFLGRIIVELEESWFGMPAGSRRVGRINRWRDADPLDLQQLDEPRVRQSERPAPPQTGSGVMKPPEITNAR